MKINFSKKYYSMPEGLSIEIEPNAVNFWVGENGSGKSVTASALMTLIQKKLGERKSNWMATELREINAVTIEGFEGVSSFSFSSSKIRQSQFVDLDVVFDLPNGFGRLNASEGENNLADLVDYLKYKDDPNHLYILDEIDGHFSAKHKMIFFDRFLNAIKGTAIVITHDIYYTVGQEKVFDFDTKTVKNGTQYIHGKIFDFPVGKKNNKE